MNDKLRNFMTVQSAKIEQAIQDMNEFRLNVARREIEMHYREQQLRM